MGKKEILSGIYMITNPIGQMYIGQSIDIQKRFNHYKKNGEMNHRLNDSIKEYGIDNHKFVVLEYCHIKKLNKKEVYYIKKYNTFNTPIGLNRNYGGGNRFSKNSNYGNAKASKNDYVKKFNKDRFIRLKMSKGITNYELSLRSNVTIEKIEQYESGRKKPMIKAYNRMIAVLKSIDNQLKLNLQ